MLGRSLSVLLLLLIMLNHAVMACDALVVHMPEHDHSLTSLIDSHGESSVTDNAEYHNEHAHVTCHIAFFYGIELLNFGETAIVTSPCQFNVISYSPPVPPPNA